MTANRQPALFPDDPRVWWALLLTVVSLCLCAMGAIVWQFYCMGAVFL